MFSLEEKYVKSMGCIEELSDALLKAGIKRSEVLAILKKYDLNLGVKK
jgi:hypothetical protein